MISKTELSLNVRDGKVPVRFAHIPARLAIDISRELASIMELMDNIDRGCRGYIGTSITLTTRDSQNITSLRFEACDIVR